MGNLFGKEIPLKDLLRQNKRMINKAVRELDCERSNLEKESKKLEADIRKMAKENQASVGWLCAARRARDGGASLSVSAVTRAARTHVHTPSPRSAQMGAVRIMARDLVRTRNYITKFIVLRSHLNAVALKLQTVKSHEAMASAMKNVTGAMIRMNKTVNVPAMQKIMADFEKEQEIANMTQEMMGESLDEVMEEDGDEEEEDRVVGEVRARAPRRAAPPDPRAPRSLSSRS